MSIKIGIVSEGVSDYWVLKHIVSRYLKDFDINTIPLKPKVTSMGKQDGFGSWQGVFKYISGEDDEKLVVEAQKEGCQFIIIQIDTDVCEEYDIKKDTSDIEAFYSNVKDILYNKIHEEFDKSTALFAICIHDLECWLIPFVSTENKKCSILDNCINTVNTAIRTKGSIDPENKNHAKAQRLYESILKKKKKPREIKECSEYNFGFKSFVDQLDNVRKILVQDATTEKGK